MTDSAFELVPIDRDGRPVRTVEPMPEMVRGACTATASLHRRVGYEPPWIGYVALSGGRFVGGGGFKGGPKSGRVEIAYFTLPELEGRGHATATARALIDLSNRADPGLQIIACTLPEPNASNHLLQKLGFTFAGPVDDPEDGLVWEWHAPPGRQACP